MTALPNALIFDCDGTLAWTGDLHFAAFSSAFAAQGECFERAYYDQRTGLDRHTLIAGWIAENASLLDAGRLVEDSIYEAARLAHDGLCRPNPLIADLAHVWGQRPSAVASNGEAAVVKAILQSCGLHDLFDTIITLDQVAAAKPDPAMFLLAAARLGAAPSECLVLEDSAQGIEAARRAGMQAFDVREQVDLERITEMVVQLRAKGHACLTVGT